MDYLAEAVTHRCIAAHGQPVLVREVFQGKTAWEGEVEVFTLANHAKAKRAYAWSYTNEARGGKYYFVTVLEIPPVDSPQTAVKVAIAATAKSKS